MSLDKLGEPTSPHLDAPPLPAFLADGGEMGALIGRHDWSKTRLGPIATWPRSLTSYVGMILKMPAPAIVFWGEDQLQIYNAGYATIMGPRHPTYLGSPYRECWPDTYPVIYPWMRRVLDGGEVIQVEKTLFTLTRHGFNEEAYFTFSFSPLRDDQDRIAGFIQPVVEVTEAVIGERRLAVLHALGARARTVADVASIAEQAFSAGAQDVPFALLFVWNDLTRELDLIADSGLDPARDRRDLSRARAAARAAVASGTPAQVDDVAELLGAPHTGPWPDPTRAAVVLPLRRSTSDDAIGALVLGVSPRLRFDAGYRAFFEAAARELATSLAAALERTSRLEILAREEAAHADADQARRRAQEADARLSFIFRQAPAAVCVLEGPEHRYTFANAQYRDLVGGRDVEGKTLTEALPEIATQGFKELLDGVRQTGKPFVGKEARVVLQRRPGAEPEEAFLDFVYQPVFGADDQVEAIFVHAVDVTETVRGRKALEDSNELLRQAADMARLGTYTWEIETDRFTSSAILRHIFGFGVGPAPEQIAPWVDRIHPDDRERVRQAVQAAVERRHDYHCEYRTIWPDGAVRHVIAKGRITAEPELRRPTRFFGTVYDITDITESVEAVRRAQAATEVERENVRVLFQQTPLIVAVLRGPDHVFEYVNPAHVRLLGKDVTGLPVREAQPEAEASGVFELLDQVYQTGEQVELQEKGVLIGTEERYFDFLYAPRRNGRGEVDGVMALVADITDLVRARQQAEQANQLKDEFLATVSHELRTPLAAMLGWIHMLRTGTLPPEKRSRAIDTIERNARAQGQLIEDLLDVGRIMSGKLKLDVEPVNLSSVVEQALESIRPAAEAKGIRIQAAMDSTASVMGDAARLQQVAWNLLTNAVKFTLRGGRVQVFVERRDSALELTVADTGQGISAEFLPHVFERFRQADGGTTRKTGGLGLGLSIVRQLVELHGGTVVATSDGVGRGATFSVRLPLSVARRREVAVPSQLRQVAARTGAACPPEIAGLRVLVVDDEADTREFLRSLLEDCRAQVTVATSASEALEAIRAFRPDVVVSDIGMPEEDGYGLIERLRALPPEAGGRTPAVALTAYTRVEDRTRALMAGFQHHVPKPIEPVEFLAVLASLDART